MILMLKTLAFQKHGLLNINYFICAQLKEQQSVLVLEEKFLVLHEWVPIVV